MIANSHSRKDRERGAGTPSHPEPFNHAVAWPALLAVWGLTPFMGDRLPAALVIVYWVLLIGSVLYGLITAVRQRSWALGLFSVLTAFAWPITLFAIFAIYGIS
ncbi:hypothetical protein DLJ54_01835 [Corynebacterium heidelbergense]|uniref:Uncharacterized protein n=1 Tax=Corynebacterium heidelbergense TaxID=2055947 RepID=A0A364V840_9CORY|nr:hypothetical protein DLJ54_01835 [Corynebacterium heidelbergense]